MDIKKDWGLEIQDLRKARLKGERIWERLIPIQRLEGVQLRMELIGRRTSLIHRFIFHFMSPNLCSLVLTRPLDWFISIFICPSDLWNNIKFFAPLDWFLSIFRSSGILVEYVFANSLLGSRCYEIARLNQWTKRSDWKGVQLRNLWIHVLSNESMKKAIRLILSRFSC